MGRKSSDSLHLSGTANRVAARWCYGGGMIGTWSLVVHAWHTGDRQCEVMEGSIPL